MRKTLVIQIGNSDDKLCQAEWAMFASNLKIEVAKRGLVHFFGASDCLSPWQNCCLVVETDQDLIPALEKAITEIRKNYRQNSAAVLVGDVRFI